MITRNNYYDYEGNELEVGDILKSSFDGSTYYFCGYCLIKINNKEIYHNLGDFWFEKVYNGIKFSNLIITQKIPIEELINRVIVIDGSVITSLLNYFYGDYKEIGERK